MKKITKERAIELLEKGFFPKCEISREVFRVIHSLDELKYYENLSIAQSFNLFGYTDKEIADYRVPDGALEVSIDDAYKLLHDCDVTIGARVIGEKEILLSELNDLTLFLRKYKSENIPFLLYWFD